MSVLAKERPARKTKVIAPTAPEPELVFENAIILRPIKMDVGTIETNIDVVLAAVKEKAEQ
jgi:hypothetical protein